MLIPNSLGISLSIFLTIFTIFIITSLNNEGIVNSLFIYNNLLPQEVMATTTQSNLEPGCSDPRSLRGGNITANAGLDQIVNAGDNVTLDPTGSLAWQIYWVPPTGYEHLVPEPLASEWNPPGQWKIILRYFDAPAVNDPTVLRFVLLGEGSNFEYKVCDSADITVRPSNTTYNTTVSN
jgi:hypothetical protein